jgi:hypothetical protein
LKDDTKQWKANFEFQQIELAFLKKLLQAKIYKPNNPNLFELLELFRKEIDALNSQISELLDSLESHMIHLEKEKQYTIPDGSQFYLETHKKLDYDIAFLNEEINMLKLRLFEFIPSVII